MITLKELSKEKFISVDSSFEFYKERNALEEGMLKEVIGIEGTTGKRELIVYVFCKDYLV